MNPENYAVTLERIIDDCSLREVLLAIVDICDGKAERRDVASWQRAAWTVKKAADAIPERLQ